MYHYIVPPLERLPGVLPLIRQRQYFVIHAARQTGKTTYLQHLVKHLNHEGTYYTAYCPLEAAQAFTEPKEGIVQIFNLLTFSIQHSGLPHSSDFGKNINPLKTAIAIKAALTDYCRLLDKPFVLLFDEVDALKNGTLITFLRQLREGYITRSTIPFPHSIALVGMRNIRDYKSLIGDDRQTLGSASPFNIVTKTFTLGNFNMEEVKALYQLHTNATGQVFEPAAVEKVLDFSNGQPWLVNALANEITSEILHNDHTQPITPDLVEQAAQNIMLRRDTHLDSLLDKLKEERVRKVIEPMLTGDLAQHILSDDTQYCLDLGLIKISKVGLEPANRIYSEVIIRALTFDLQFSLERQVQNTWVTPKGELDMDGLLKAFQQFWRKNSEIWKEKFEYKEAAPQLILQAFLQRIVNGGGRIDREYGLGRGRTDLYVQWPHTDGTQREVIELKVLRYSLEKTIETGMQQTAAYMDKCGADSGHLLIFDRRPGISWEEKIFHHSKSFQGKTMEVWGC